jgi:UDPglucose 6-dehydrogenase
VGDGVRRLFGDKVVAVYDPQKEVKGKKLYQRRRDFRNVDMAIVCVMTKQNKDDSCDVSIVEESVRWLEKENRNMIILVKSAVPPLKIEKIKNKYKARVVISPEYLGESKYFTPFWKFPDPTEMKYHDFQIFGGDKKDTSECVDIFQSVMGPTVKYYQTDLKTAALCKYMENSFGAMKVTFCNEWYDIAKAHGVDYNELREIWTADPRVGQMHTVVFSKKRGFGGKCFPKDTRAIIKESEELGYKPELMKSMDKVNKKFVKLNEQL